MGALRGPRDIVLAPVLFLVANGGRTAGDKVHLIEPGILNDLGIVPVLYFGAHHPYRRIVVKSC
jgi:hypothetical protein